MRPDCRCGAALIISADWQKLTKEEELEPNWERSLGSGRTVQTCPERPADRFALQTVQKLQFLFHLSFLDLDSYAVVKKKELYRHLNWMQTSDEMRRRKF